MNMFINESSVNNTCITYGTTTTGGTDCTRWVYYPETYPYPMGTGIGDFDWKFNIKDSEIENLKEELEKIKAKLKREGVLMKSLFSVVVVDIDGNIVLDTKVVGEDETDAQFTADVHGVLKEKNLKPKNVTIIVDELAEVKCRKETQKVKIVKEDEE